VEILDFGADGEIKCALIGTVVRLSDVPEAM